MSIDFKLTDADQPLLELLVKPHRAILLLAHELPDPSYKGIALYLSVPVGTVKSRLSRARHCLMALREQQQFEQQLLTAATEAAEQL